MTENKRLCPFMSRVIVLQSKAEFHTVACGKETCELWVREEDRCAMGSKATKTKKTVFYRWVAVMDMYTCDECKARHNTIFDQSQINALSTDGLLPPLHDEDDHLLACRCVIEKVNDEKD